VAKADVVVGTSKVSIEGTPEEVASLIALLAAGPAPHPTQSAKQEMGGGRRAPRRDGPVGLVRQLIDEGFFSAKRDLAAVQARLEEKAHIYPAGTLSPVLFRLVKARELRRIKEDGSWKYVNP
jgi:hypothetical protein